MKLKDIKDVKRYLENDCYCSHEIYSSDGFFYQLFYPDYECKIIADNERFTAVISQPYQSKDERGRAQIIIFWKSEDKEKVVDVIRYDATENNIKMIVNYSNKKITKDEIKLDEYEEGSTAKELEKIFSIADDVIID